MVLGSSPRTVVASIQRAAPPSPRPSEKPAPLTTLHHRIGIRIQGYKDNISDREKTGIQSKEGKNRYPMERTHRLGWRKESMVSWTCTCTPVGHVLLQFIPIYLYADFEHCSCQAVQIEKLLISPSNPDFTELNKNKSSLSRLRILISPKNKRP
jgi:hypothetical protein